MPKSKIIKDLVEDTVSIEQSLTRLQVLAKDIGNKQLATWAENELTGYRDKNDVPEYRRYEDRNFVYSGINGGFKVTNSPLPYGVIDEETLKNISNLIILDGIKSIEDATKNKNDNSYRDLTFLAGIVSDATDGQVVCSAIYQIIPKSLYQRIISQVKNKMITALCELEKSYGVLDELGIDISNKSTTQINYNNDELNRTVFNINLPSTSSEKKEKWYSKIAWNILIPIITAIIGAVVATLVIKLFGL